MRGTLGLGVLLAVLSLPHAGAVALAKQHAHSHSDAVKQATLSLRQITNEVVALQTEQALVLAARAQAKDFPRPDNVNRPYIPPSNDDRLTRIRNLQAQLKALPKGPASQPRNRELAQLLSKEYGLSPPPTIPDLDGKTAKEFPNPAFLGTGHYWFGQGSDDASDDGSFGRVVGGAGANKEGGEAGKEGGEAGKEGGEAGKEGGGGGDDDETCEECRARKRAAKIRRLVAERMADEAEGSGGGTARKELGLNDEEGSGSAPAAVAEVAAGSDGAGSAASAAVGSGDAGSAAASADGAGSAAPADDAAPEEAAAPAAKSDKRKKHHRTTITLDINVK